MLCSTAFQQKNIFLLHLLFCHSYKVLYKKISSITIDLAALA